MFLSEFRADYINTRFWLPVVPGRTNEFRISLPKRGYFCGVLQEGKQWSSRMHGTNSIRSITIVRNGSVLTNKTDGQYVSFDIPDNRFHVVTFRMLVDYPVEVYLGSGK